MIKRGYTLIETIIVISISTLMLMALAHLFFIFNSLYGYQQGFIATAGSNGAAMNALEAAILPADHVLTSHSFSGATYTSGITTLVLELPAVDASGAIITSAEDYVAFYTSSSTLYRLTEAAAGSVRVSGLKQLSSTIYSLSFTYNTATIADASILTADIQTQASIKQQIVQSHLTRQWRLRNFQPTP